MLLFEFLFSFPAAISALFVAVFLYRSDSPVIETKILSSGFLSACFLFSGMTISAVLHTPNTTCLLGVMTHRIGFAFAQLSLILMSLAIIVPNFKANYRSILIVCTITAINVASAVVNGLTIDHVVIGEYIQVVILPLGRVFFVISIVLFLATPAVRIIEIYSITRNRSSPFTSTGYLAIFLLLMTISLSIIVMEQLFANYPHGIMPGFTWLVPMTVENLFFVYAFRKDSAFFFITPARLEAVIITNHSDGEILFSRIFKETLPAEVLVGSLFTVMNRPLQNKLQYSPSVEQINFGDKIVLLAPGSKVTTLMVVNERNLATAAISKYLTREFEKQFPQELQITKNTDTSVFREFETVVSRIQTFIPRTHDLTRDALVLSGDDKLLVYAMIQRVHEGIKVIQDNMHLPQEEAETTRNQTQASIKKMIDFIEKADEYLEKKVETIQKE